MPPRKKSDDAERARRIAKELALAYPDVGTALRFESPFQLLIATILAAQCTDEKVNQVTAVLFDRFPKPADLAAADPAEVEELIHATGFFRQKTKSIQSASRDLVEQFGGAVPRELEELVSLRGVARKTANVVRGNAFGLPGIAIDTHMKRVNQRLGLTRSDDPVKIERDLMALLPEDTWTDYTNQVIHHGRTVCKARKPRCGECGVASLCPSVEADEAAPSRRKASRSRKRR